MKTGNTAFESQLFMIVGLASMEPGHEDREYHQPTRRNHHRHPASMEPGHEDREYMGSVQDLSDALKPQWSPVMKTGNTSRELAVRLSRSCLNGARS